MKRQNYASAHDLLKARNGQGVALAGIVLIRQRPGSAKGVCFITLEDETGVVNLVVWPKVMTQYRKVIMGARLIEVEGYVQRDEDVIHVVVRHLKDRTDALDLLSNDPLQTTIARADHVLRPLPRSSAQHPRNVRILPKSRDFH